MQLVRRYLRIPVMARAKFRTFSQSNKINRYIRHYIGALCCNTKPKSSRLRSIPMPPLPRLLPDSHWASGRAGHCLHCGPQTPAKSVVLLPPLEQNHLHEGSSTNPSLVDWIGGLGISTPGSCRGEMRNHPLDTLLPNPQRKLSCCELKILDQGARHKDEENPLGLHRFTLGQEPGKCQGRITSHSVE